MGCYEKTPQPEATPLVMLLALEWGTEWLLSPFFHDCDKTPDNNSLREEGFGDILRLYPDSIVLGAQMASFYAVYTQPRGPCRSPF